MLPLSRPFSREINHPCTPRDNYCSSVELSSRCYGILGRCERCCRNLQLYKNGVDYWSNYPSGIFNSITAVLHVSHVKGVSFLTKSFSMDLPRDLDFHFAPRCVLDLISQLQRNIAILWFECFFRQNSNLI